MDRWDEFKFARESLQKEYDLVAHQWRFLQGGRLIFLGIVATACATLFGGYNAASAVFHQSNLAVMSGVNMLVTSSAGLVLSFLSFAMEIVIERMIRATTQRAVHIELSLGLFTGAFSSVGNVGWGVSGFTISRILNTVFILLVIVWAILLGRIVAIFALGNAKWL